MQLGRKVGLSAQLAVLAAFILLIGAAVLGARWLASGTDARPGPSVNSPSPVVIATATTKPVPFEVTTIGRIQTIASVAVRSRIDGVITSVGVQEGRHVAAGDLLFTLDDRELRGGKLFNPVDLCSNVVVNAIVVRRAIGREHRR